MTTRSRVSISPTFRALAAAGIAAGLATPAGAAFESLWILGIDDGSQAEFSQENGSSNDISIGDDLTQDDDYFFAGSYDFGLEVPVDEDWFNFDRALTNGDVRNRIHFNLSAEEAAGGNRLNLVVDFVLLGGGSTHDVEILFNDTEVWSDTGIAQDTLADVEFGTADVGAVAGENIVTVERTGGGANNPWIQFDYVELFVDQDPSGCPDPVCSFKASRTFVQPGDAVTLSWTANTGSTLVIDNGVGDVTGMTVDGIGTVDVMPTVNTTYTMTATNGGATTMMTVDVDVDILTDFAAQGAWPDSAPEMNPDQPIGPVARPGQPVTLTWVLADPSATVEIDNGIGDVTGMTVDGVGSIELSGDLAPDFDTFYTITATRGDDIEFAEVDVLVSENELIWYLGLDNAGTGEFSQEAGANDPPGDYFVRDDDYYFAGDFTAYDPFIGNVTESEVWGDPETTGVDAFGFERAITHGDLNNRLHFILDADEAAAGTFLFLNVDLMGGGYPESSPDGPGGTFGVHDVRVTFNDVEIANEVGITGDTLLELMFTAGSVGAAAGHNVVEVTRTGGDSQGNGSGLGWIQFDYLSLEANTSPEACAEPICNFSASKSVISPGESIDLSWFASPTATLTIDNGVGSVDGDTVNGLGSTTVSPTSNTVYTLTADDGGTVETMEVMVDVVLVESFDAEGALQLSDPVARPGQPVQLVWSVDPAPGVTVAIDQGVGDVTSITTDGVGSLGVNPGAPTTYTITATRGSDVVTASVDVGVSDWQLLWQVGVEDNTQGEFSQEGGSNPPPGDPFFQDDDYYTAGDYTAFDPFIGVVEDSEPWVNFDRAITSGDPNNRIYFIMTPEQAAPENQIRFRTIYIGGGNSAGGFGDHDTIVTFNGVQVSEEISITANRPVEEVVTAGSVNAVAGVNTVEVTRTGGLTDGWIQFDYVTGEVQGPVAPPAGDGFSIIDFNPDFTIGDMTLTWRSEAGKSYRIESSVLLDSWNPEATGIASQGATTTATVNVGIPAPEGLNLRVAEE